jgi:hypothetical protein
MKEGLVQHEKNFMEDNLSSTAREQKAGVVRLFTRYSDGQERLE